MGKKSVGKYELSKTLSEGAFMKIKEAVDTETSESCIIKIIEKEQIRGHEQINRIKWELNMLKCIEHKFVLGVKDVLMSKVKIFIVVELVDIDSNLFLNKIASDGIFNEEKALFYFQQLVEGVAYMHSMKMYHCYWKSENLIVDRSGNLKLCGFGETALTSLSEPKKNFLHCEVLHPEYYMAPETMRTGEFDRVKADIWSMGTILYTILAGEVPFDHEKFGIWFELREAADYIVSPLFSAEVAEFLSLLIVANPDERLSIAEIESHQWVNMRCSGESKQECSSKMVDVDNGSAEIWDQEDIIEG